MIFHGRKHPIFESYVNSNVVSKANFIDTQKSNTKGDFFSSNKLKNNQQYFFHSELPLIDPSLDIEYIFNIEDQMTMFKSINNGVQYSVDLSIHHEVEYIKYVLEDKRCKKIICHIEKMAQALPNLLKSKAIEEKTIFKNIGVQTQPSFKKTNKDEFVLLFTNSYHNWPVSFNLRGGPFLIQAAERLSLQIPNLKIIIRSSIPSPNDIFLSKHSKIELHTGPLSEKEMDVLYRRADLFILPSIRVHSHSICKALSYGIPVIASNGWGNEEYIQHDHNGIIIQGFENFSWHKDNIGCIENYNNIPQPDLAEFITNQMYQYIMYIYNNPDYLNTLKENARETCLTKYSLLNWNEWKI